MAGLGRRMRVGLLEHIRSSGAGGAGSVALSAMYAGFGHTTSPGDDASGVQEPTIGTGGYTRAQLGTGGVTWSAISTPSAGAVARLQNSGAVTWGGTTQGAASTAPWSTGTTPLAYLCYWTGATGVTEATFVGFGAVSTPPQVNAAGVTLTAATGALEINMDDT